MSTYIVSEIKPEDINEELKTYLVKAADDLNRIYGERYDLRCFDLKEALRRNSKLYVCKRGEMMLGLLMFRLSKSFWDRSKVVCLQDLLYAEHPVATYRLMKEFIDFGKTHADDVVSVIGLHTNIKPKSLERLGFLKDEEVYRMVVNVK